MGAAIGALTGALMLGIQGWQFWNLFPLLLEGAMLGLIGDFLLGSIVGVIVRIMQSLHDRSR